MTDIRSMPTLGKTESGGEIKMRRTLYAAGRGTQAAEIVIAFLPHNDVTPYATWQMNVADQSTYWGHYFREADEALADYEKRGR